MKRFLGKLFFPDLPSDLRDRRMNIILAVVVVGVLFGCLVALVSLASSKVGPR